MQHIKRTTLPITYTSTLDWLSPERLVDWVGAGCVYSAQDGSPLGQLGQYRLAYGFDAAITSPCGRYAFVYKRLGTKGLLLKDGMPLRELNRSYYQAQIYEYPAAFALSPEGKTFLVHCPQAYNRLDLECAESGALLGVDTERRLRDVFYSRLELGPGGRYLMHRGWVWQPWDVVEVFDLKACFTDPALLDQGRFPEGCGAELCTAGFLDEERVLLGASTEETDEDEPLPSGHIAVWNLGTGTLSQAVRPAAPFGNLFVIDERYAWDLYLYPKIIDLYNGNIIAALPELHSGKQRSSIIGNLNFDLPLVAFCKQSKRLALGYRECVEILEYDAQTR